MNGAFTPRPELSFVIGPPLSEEAGLGALTLPGYLKEVADRFADREALVMHHSDRVERWSYADLWQRAVEVARALVGIGLGKDGRVGILMTNRPEWFSAVFGTALAGGVAVPLSTFSTEQELDYLLKASDISALLFERSVLKKDFGAILAALEPAVGDAKPGQLRSIRFPFLRHVAVVDEPFKGGVIEPWDAFLARGSATPAALIDAIADAVRPTDAGGIFFSSGSSALAKGVVSAQRGIAIQLWRWRRMFNLHGDIRAWTPNGFFWSGNFAAVVGSTFSSGGALILQRTFVPDEALVLMEKERVSFPFAWPHQNKQLEEAPNWADVDLSSVRFVDPANPLAQHPTVTPADWEEPRWSYGSTETFTITASFPQGTPLPVTGESKGAVLPGNMIKIVDPETGATLPRGESGEIAVKGATLMLGYLGVPPEQAFDVEGFYRSGDAGRIDEEGRLFFEGRLTTIIKTGGANVSALEVDGILETFPGVKVARSVGVPHETLGEMVVACIVPGKDMVLDAAAIHGFAKERLASYKVPRRFLLLRDEDLALTGSAKIKPAELRALAVKRLAQEQGEAMNEAPQ